MTSSLRSPGLSPVEVEALVNNSHRPDRTLFRRHWCRCYHLRIDEKRSRRNRLEIWFLIERQGLALLVHWMRCLCVAVDPTKVNASLLTETIAGMNEWSYTLTWSEFQAVSSRSSNINVLPFCLTSLFKTELTLKHRKNSLKIIHFLSYNLNNFTISFVLIEITCIWIVYFGKYSFRLTWFRVWRLGFIYKDSMRSC